MSYLVSLLLPFYLFVPGYYLNKILKLNKELSFPAKIGFAIVTSVALINFVFIAFNNFLLFEKNLFISLILLINASILGVYFLYFKDQKEKKVFFNRENFLLLLIALIPFLLFIVRVILNPYLTDQDGAAYVTAMQDVKLRFFDSSFLNPRRLGFTYIVMPIHYLSNIDFIEIFKFILPGVVWLSFMSAFALIEKNTLKNKYFVAVIYLLILLAPAFIDHIDRFKPETISFMMTLPSIIMFVFSVIKKNYQFYILGLLYALVAFKSHDAGSILLLSYLTGGLVYLIFNLRGLKTYLNFKNIILVIIIIAPYLLLFKISDIIGVFRDSLNFFPHSLSDFHFRWWFLNNYSSAGGELGWPGWTFILFYAYNGILAVVLMILLLLYVKKRKLKGKKEFFLAASAILFNIIFFLTVSEVLPRFGFFFLPDRAWLHLFYFSVIFIILVLYFWPQMLKLKLTKYLVYIVSANIILSIFVSTFLVLTAGSLISRSEKNLIEKIKDNTPENAIILSTQKYNNVMVEKYAKRDFINIDLPDSAKNQKMADYILERINIGQIAQNPDNFLTVTNKIIDEATISRYGGLISYKEKKIIAEKTREPLKEELLIKKDRPVYLFYSFSKTDGLLNKIGRKYWTAGIDLKSRDFFWNFENPNVFYKDKAGIIIKIR